MEYLQLIISSVFAICTLFIVGYIKKRADNIATKKDIQAITEKIETVKAKLQIETKGTMDFRSDQRATVLNFYDSFVNWYYIVLDLANINLDEDNLEEIKNYHTKIDSTYTALILHDKRIDLYLSEDEEIQATAQNLISQGLKVESIVRKFLTDVYFEYEDLHHYQLLMKEGKQINESDYSRLNNKIEKLWKDLEEKSDLIDDEVELIIEEYLSQAKKYINVNIS